MFAFGVVLILFQVSWYVLDWQNYITWSLSYTFKSIPYFFNINLYQHHQINYNMLSFHLFYLPPFCVMVLTLWLIFYFWNKWGSKRICLYHFKAKNILNSASNNSFEKELINGITNRIWRRRKKLVGKSISGFKMSFSLEPGQPIMWNYAFRSGIWLPIWRESNSDVWSFLLHFITG